MNFRKAHESDVPSVRTKKSFVAKKPQTTVVLTEAGRRAYTAYLDQLKRLLQGR
jgi:hypothetical protein